MAFKFNPWKACSSTHNAWKLPNDVWFVDSFMLTSAVCHLFGFSIWSLSQICLFSDSKFLSILASHIQMFHNWTIECQISRGQHSATTCIFFLTIPGSWSFYEFEIFALLVFHSSIGKHVLATCIQYYSILTLIILWILLNLNRFVIYIVVFAFETNSRFQSSHINSFFSISAVVSTHIHS